MTCSILIVDDEVVLLRALEDFFAAAGYRASTATSGEAGLARAERERPDLVILDLVLPDGSGVDLVEEFRELGARVIMLTGFGEIETAVRAIKLGAENFLTKPVDLDHLAASVESSYEKIRLERKLSLLKTTRPTGRLGVSPPVKVIEEQVERLAASERTTVLVQGETGTGKSWVIRMIHEASSRAAEPLVDVPCGSLTPATLHSELFGHEPGSFPEAGGLKKGLLELADGGSVVLEEVGELAPEIQPALLGVLEHRSFRRLGGTNSIATDIRLMASSSRDLLELVNAGRFREDLFYRLNVLPINLPPLREREPEDVIALVRFFLDDLKPGIPGAPGEIEPGALERLLKYTWPGNVRELKNVIERALIMAQGAERLQPEHLPFDLRRVGRRRQVRRTPRSIRDMEARHIENTLRIHGGNRTHAARELGISRPTLIKKIKQYNIEL